MKKPTQDKTNWRAKYDAILSLLWLIRNDPRSGFNDLCLRNTNAEKLRTIISANKRYVWRKVGEASYLYPLHSPAEAPVAFVIKAGKKHEWKMTGRGLRAESGSEKSLAAAQAAAEKPFVLFEKE